MYYLTHTAWGVTLSLADFLCEQICNLLRFWSNFLKEILKGDLVSCTVSDIIPGMPWSWSPREQLNIDRSYCCLDVFIFGLVFIIFHLYHVSLAKGTWWKDTPVFRMLLPAGGIIFYLYFNTFFFLFYSLGILVL